MTYSPNGSSYTDKSCADVETLFYQKGLAGLYYSTAIYLFLKQCKVV